MATYSIAARDPATGALGVAVASKFLAVGALVPFVQAGVGAVATQARTNMTYGPQVLELLASGVPPSEAARMVQAADGLPEYRQLGIVAAGGPGATVTGSGCRPWAGGLCGADFAIQGNVLRGPGVVEAMAAAWQETTGWQAFGRRLLRVLDAGEERGGDARGRQAAALLTVLPDGTKTDLRVDDHPEPLRELARLLALWETQGGGNHPGA